MNEPRDLSHEDAAHGAHPRWYQFRLRTIFIAMVVLGCLLAAYRAYIEPCRQQRQAMNRIKELGGMYQATAAETWQRWLFGNDYQNLTFVNLADCDQVDEYLPHVLRLPHLETLVVGGPAFGDDQLQQLNRAKTLKSLVLDSTSVSLEQAERFREDRLFGPADYARTHFEYSDQKAATALAKLGVTVTNWSSSFASDDLKWQLGSKYFERAITLEVTGAIDERVAEHLNRLSSVASIYVNNARAGDGDLLHLAKLRRRDEWKHLELVLKGTQVTDAGLADLRPLTWLHRLDLENTSVTDVGIAHLTSLAELRSLNLSGTKVTDEGLGHLIAIPELYDVDLAQTSVTDAGMAKLKEMRQLGVLGVTNTKVTAAGIRALSETLPDCSIFGVISISRKDNVE